MVETAFWMVGILGVMGCGGALQDCHGKLLFGFAKHLDNGSNLEAEALGLLHGMQMCKAAHYKHVLIDPDSKELIDIINGSDHRLRLLMELSGKFDVSFVRVITSFNVLFTRPIRWWTD
ncbi:hypothetical protein ACH5RR_015622 [Cinchona calisaya]|uniref:RNase H type-1 domain-containing protein n=1 Tax=Cinchona calisaya TaxID=153742 RepID=A0ABD2ZUW8_9GENT